MSLKVAFNYLFKVMVVFIIGWNNTMITTKVIEGELITKENWGFLTQYCFLSQVGLFKYEVTYPKEYGPQKLLLYFDGDSLASIYNSGKTCEEKEGVLKIEYHQIINLTEYDSNYIATHASGCKLDVIDGVDYYNCSHYRKFASSKERWWFIAVDNCESTKGLRLKYKITMTNDPDDTSQEYTCSNTTLPMNFTSSTDAN